MQSSKSASLATFVDCGVLGDSEFDRIPIHQIRLEVHMKTAKLHHIVQQHSGDGTPFDAAGLAFQAIHRILDISLSSKLSRRL